MKKEIRQGMESENGVMHTWYYGSPVGTLEIRASVSAIHAILFSPGNKKRNKKDITSSEILKQCCQQLNEYFLGTRKVFNFAFAQEGTPFQQKVWNELIDIPYGKTMSYLELSRRIGDMKAIRAVGAANGKNNLVIVVPCHRVIGSNGSLVGYGGELWRKRWLLDHENRFENGVHVLFSNEVKDNSHKS